MDPPPWQPLWQQSETDNPVEVEATYEFYHVMELLWDGINGDFDNESSASGMARIAGAETQLWWLDLSDELF
jgi:hypothetical protein